MILHYLDYNATTPVLPEVRDAMLPFLGEDYGNPSSLHAVGARARKALDEARLSMARLLGCSPNELIFNNGGTESIHAALRGVVTSLALSQNRRPLHVITTAIEHSSVLGVVSALEKEGLLQATYLPVDAQGHIELENLKTAFREDTVLVSVMFANNETGNIHPVVEIGRLCRERGVLFHSDAIQALGKVPIDLQALPVDLMSFAAHKIYGPKGAGALFVRRGTPLVSLIPGTQEGERRGGTENLPGIVGFARALEIASRDLEVERHRLSRLRDELQKGLMESIEGVRVHGDPLRRLSNTLNVSFEGIESNTLLMCLDQEGIYVSSGSACASGAARPSHVLLAMGVSRGEAKGAIRFSLGRGTSENDIESVLEKIPRIVSRLRES